MVGNHNLILLSIIKTSNQLICYSTVFLTPYENLMNVNIK